MDLLLLIPVCLLSGFLVGAIGFGGGLVLIPPAFILLPPAQAVVAVSLLSNVGNILILTERRRKEVWWREFGILSAAAAPGLVVGALLLHRLDKHTAEFLVGVAVLAGILIQSAIKFKPAKKARAGWLRTALAGGVGGVLTTSTGSSGPLVIMWMLARTSDRMKVRDTLNAHFLYTGLAAPLIIAILVGWKAALPSLWTLALLTIMVFAGYQIGQQWFHHLAGDEHYRRAATWLLAALAAASIAAAVL